MDGYAVGSVQCPTLDSSCSSLVCGRSGGAEQARARFWAWMVGVTMFGAGGSGDFTRVQISQPRVRWELDHLRSGFSIHSKKKTKVIFCASDLDPFSVGLLGCFEHHFTKWKEVGIHRGCSRVKVTRLWFPSLLHCQLQTTTHFLLG